MPENAWTLLDVEENVYVDELQISARDVRGAAAEFSIHKHRLRGGRRDGVDLVEVDNGRFRFSVIPTRGMGLWKAECEGHNLGWQAPVRGPVHPSLVPLSEPGGLGWLDGFDEFLVRCGLESNGSPVFTNGQLEYPLHGKIANRPAHRLTIAFDSEADEIVIRGEVEESRLFFKQWLLVTTIRTKLNEPGLRITDEIINQASTPRACQLLYHVNFGAPILEAGSKVVVAAERVVPRNQRAAEGIESWDTFGPPESGFAEQVYLIEPRSNADQMAQALLRNAQGSLGASLNFNVQQLPRFVVWKCTQATTDGYVAGLEPTTNWPNSYPFESGHGRTVQVEPQGSFTSSLQLQVHTTADSVKQIESAILRQQGEHPADVSPVPLPDWAE